MLKNFNVKIFYLINATSESPQWVINLARFIAKDLISIIPILLIIFWLWGHRNHRERATKVIVAFIIGIFFSFFLRKLFPYNRPFVDHIGHNFLYHVASNSFPSIHGTITFTFALSFFFWYYTFLPSIIVLFIAIAVSWSRIYLGVHWPLDIIGSFLVALISCVNTKILWNLFGSLLFSKIEKNYRYYFATFIRKGWIRN